MLLTERDLGRVSVVLYLRGFALLALAAVAIRWPDEVLYNAMLTAGVVVGVLGVCELALVAVSSTVASAKGLMMVHACLSIAFGALALMARTATLATSMRMIGAWLLMQAIVALAIAARVKSAGLARPLLVAWSAVNVAASFLVLTYAWMTLVALMYIGAGYAAAYGVVQIATARWIRHAVA